MTTGKDQTESSWKTWLEVDIGVTVLTAGRRTLLMVGQPHDETRTEQPQIDSWYRWRTLFAKCYGDHPFLTTGMKNFANENNGGSYDSYIAPPVSYSKKNILI
jgi:hypothetical protein